MTLYTSLAGFWKLDEASGSRADSIGATTLTDNNTVTSNTGLVYALAAECVQANNEYLSAVSSAALQAGNIDFWVATWVKFSSLAGNPGLVSKTSGTSAANTEYHLSYVTATSRFRFGISDGTTITTVTADTFGAPTTGVWYLVVGWYDAIADLIKISVNGGTPDSAAQTVGAQASTKAFEIGRVFAATNQDLSGLIGPAMLGKSYLITTDDLTYLYNGGAGRTLADMAGGGTNYPQTVAGTLTSSGALARGVAKTFAGTLTTAGALLRSTTKAFTGTLVSSGALLRNTGKVVVGTLTSSGALVTSLTFLVAIGGALTMAGALARSTGKTLVGTLTTSGALSRAISKFVAGALSFIGTLIAAIVGGSVQLLDVEVTDSAVHTVTLSDSTRS